MSILRNIGEVTAFGHPLPGQGNRCSHSFQFRELPPDPEAGIIVSIQFLPLLDVASDIITIDLSWDRPARADEIIAAKLHNFNEFHAGKVELGNDYYISSPRNVPSSKVLSVTFLGVFPG